MLLSSFVTPILPFQNKPQLQTRSPGHSHPANSDAEDHVGEHHLVTNTTIIALVETTRGRKANAKLRVPGPVHFYIFCLFVLGDVSF